MTPGSRPAWRVAFAACGGETGGVGVPHETSNSWTQRQEPPSPGSVPVRPRAHAAAESIS
jgi:hypothetical protein